MAGTGAGSSEVRRVAFASFIGTTIEWYDFFIYGTAALVFNQLFFPNFDPLLGTLAAFATFAVGFIARPLGGAVFAHFGPARRIEADGSPFVAEVPEDYIPEPPLCGAL